MNQSKTKLTLRPIARICDGPILNLDAPVFLYDVNGVPNNELLQIVNYRAHGRDPSWQIRYVKLDAEIGSYKTTEEALAVLQHLIDEPTGILAGLHRAECEWLDRWGTVPEHPWAKAAHRDVEAWESIVAAHIQSSRLP
jgi:hypothetical protein